MYICVYIPSITGMHPPILSFQIPVLTSLRDTPRDILVIHHIAGHESSPGLRCSLRGWQTGRN